MKAAVLFSGGKDSALAALMLARDYQVELNTFVFDQHHSLPAVEAAADALSLPLIRRTFGTALRDRLVVMIRQCGYPNDAINLVHRYAITALAEEYAVVGDGTRLNDRVPMLTFGEVQRIEAKYGCSYVRPLLGFGRTEVNRLVDRLLIVQYGESSTLQNGDYEHELRDALVIQGVDPSAFFPQRHEQSLICGIK
ncbi:alpha hydrolase [Methanosphaerula palustris]|uniref:PP-loop domain-containing protein n=1 Tax=Methanosphaerula palustris (strain ATCC BAA-1556 / DSM 19958 / E1-9c) TaxID=521011 RepID=B8GEU3_METPE|nr:alpha hydrolase [Methanosphaerula palustris]ACL15910.1 PP-loop domain-containing protein [Methanosphaerula palustris E1-9c]